MAFLLSPGDTWNIACYSLAHLLLMLMTCFDPLRTLLGDHWASLGISLGSFWEPFGSTLQTFWVCLSWALGELSRRLLAALSHALGHSLRPIRYTLGPSLAI